MSRSDGRASSPAGSSSGVALARALVNRPKALLLDEPLGALDLKLRKAMQLELKELNRETGATFIYVTHDQEEALTMSDRIAVMNEGPSLPARAHRPRSTSNPVDRFVADFIGQSNLIPGTLEARDGDRCMVRIPTGGLVQARLRDDPAVGASVVVSVRPERVESQGQPAESLDGSIAAMISEMVYLGSSQPARAPRHAGLASDRECAPTDARHPGDRSDATIPSRYATCFAAE